MAKYNPDAELTETELNALDEKDFFEYLDSKAKYLKQFTRPLDTYHAKTFAALANGGNLSTEELQTAKEIGRIGDEAKHNAIAEATEKLGGDPKYKDEGIKNVKTHRSQWFD
jgi:hypothetical protein